LRYPPALALCALTLALATYAVSPTAPAQTAPAQKASAPKKTSSAVTILDCRGPLETFSGQWSKSDTEAIVSIHLDDKKVVYDGVILDGTYAITKSDDKQVTFSAVGRQNVTAEGSVNRYSGQLIINTSDSLIVARLRCKPAERLF
jgi:hypothetical protein